MTLTEEAQTLMLHQFASSPRLSSLIIALIQPFQEALEGIEALRDGRYIDQAQGASLDVIGSIAGQERRGMSDEDYRPWIKVRILLNKSAGTPEHIFAILSILFDGMPKVLMEEYAPNMAIFTFHHYPRCPAKVLFSIIRSALPLGTTCRFIKADPPISLSSTHDRENRSGLKAFRFDVSMFSESYFADFHEEDEL